MAENGSDESSGELTREEIIRLRHQYIGSSGELFFGEDALCITRGEGTYLFDDQGKRYLDCINNVCHVGHSNPAVVAAISEQAAVLNTNNRYLHPTIVLLAKRLINTFSSSVSPRLTRVTFVNSGSEATDLALRMARAHTGQEDVITLDHAYHGHVTSAIEISPYKSKKLGVRTNYVHEAPCPDTYNGEITDLTHPGLSAEELGEKYADRVRDIVEELGKSGRRPAAFIAESLQSCGGQIIPPSGYLRRVFGHIRAAGGVCISDEVQVGFGRVGTWWAFQAQGEDVAPDIVTIGKPMGNGHPVAAVIYTEEINTSFSKSGVCYFNTYGGNPVSCAAAMAVMDEIEGKNLMQNCCKIGTLLKDKLDILKKNHPLIGDVRVLGMFAGVELVKSHETREPATEVARRVLNRMREEGVLVSLDGPHCNVIKFKPPIVFNEENVHELVSKLDQVLTEVEGANGLREPDA